MKSKFNVLIVGAGQIGALLDNPKSKNILTHAHAFLYHKGFNLVGFVDNDKKRAIKAAKIWKVNAYDNLEKAFSSNSVDVVCIATSTDTHKKTLEEVLKHPIKLILLEKPIAKTLYESEKIIELCKKTNTHIAVNYIRRFLPEFEKIKVDINKGVYGKFIVGTGYYGKGLLNNGSHIIDLLHFFFGKISGFQVVSGFNDLSSDDQTITAAITLPNNKSFFLQGINSRPFSLFEVDLIFEKRRIRIIESGLKVEIHKVQKNKIFSGYNSMIKCSESVTSLNRYMYYVADNIYKKLTTGEAIKCDILDGYKAADVCFKILEKYS